MKSQLKEKYLAPVSLILLWQVMGRGARIYRDFFFFLKFKVNHVPLYFFSALQLVIVTRNQKPQVFARRRKNASRMSSHAFSRATAPRRQDFLFSSLVAVICLQDSQCRTSCKPCPSPAAILFFPSPLMFACYLCLGPFFHVLERELCTRYL